MPLSESPKLVVKTRHHGRWRRFFARILALGVVSCALIISLAKLALPWLSAHPETIESYLSVWLHTPVKITSVRSEWDARPKLNVQGLRLGDPGSPNAIEIAQVAIELDPFGFLPGRRWVEDFSILGAELTLSQTTSGWHVDGLGLSAAVSVSNSDRLNLLGAIGQLSIHDVTLNVRTLAGGAARIENAAVALRRRAGELRAALQFSPPSVAEGAHAPVTASTNGQVVVRTRWNEGSDSLALYFQVKDAQLGDLGALASLMRTAPTRQLDQLAGAVNSQFWVSLKQGAMENGQLQINLHDERDLPTANLSLFSRNGANWTGQLQLVDQAATELALDISDSKRFSLQLASATAPVAITALTQTLGAHLPVEVASNLAKRSVQGNLNRFSAQFGAGMPWRANVAISSLNLAPDGRIPGVRNADLIVRADAAGASIALSGQQFELKAPTSFRKTIQLDNLALSAAVWPDSEGWSKGYSAEISDIALSAPGYDATAYVRIEKQGEAPAEITVSLDCSRGDIAYAGQFWAIDKMPPKVIAWLDAALLSGQTGNAKAIYRGPLKRGEFPFLQAQGRFEAQFELKAAEIRFSPDWPVLGIKEGSFSLLNASFATHRLEGKTAGNIITKLEGGIDNFKLPVARFSVAGGGDAKDLLALLRASPIGRDFGTHFSGLNAAGDANVEMSMVLPLKAELGEREVDGIAQLQGATLQNPDWQLALSGVKGAIAFDRVGFLANDLAAVQNELPVRLSAAVGEHHTGVNKVLIDAALKGAMRPDVLFAHEKVLAPILAKVSGNSEWTVRVKTIASDQAPVAVVAEPAAGAALAARSEQITSTAPAAPPVAPNVNNGNVTTIELSSDLVGVKIDLPNPLGKLADQRRALRLSVPSETESQRAIVLDIDGEVRFVAQLSNAQRPFRGALTLGDSNLDADLPSQGLRIKGDLKELNVLDWAVLVGGTAAAAGGISLADVQVQAAKLTGPLAQFAGAMRFSAVPSAQGWKVDFDSTAAKGHLLWRTDLASPTLTAQFKHLHVPEFDAGPALQSTIDPRLIPVLHVYVEDFSVGTAMLGATRLESYPTAEGMRIDLLESKSADLTLTGSGDWKAAGDSYISTFKLNFSAQDLGRMLSGLGFSGHVEGGQTLAEIDARWSGSPIDFALARLNGKLKVWVGNGRFLELSPGAGRLFGLLSLRELPRRLALDFRDFFQSGMSFSEINGSFSFSDGNAYTEGVHIKAPAADITIMGRTGLSARDYEQTALVSPKVGMLPVVGAIAAGPAGAAAGLLAQGVLEGENTLAASYKISGSWEQPLVVKQIARREAKRESEEKKR